MATSSFIFLISTIVSVFAIFLSLSIFKKVYQENYKKPWLYIGVSVIFLGFDQILSFLSGFKIYIINISVTEYITYILDFIGITILTYALVLEYLLLSYYKGKFVKMKFIPVQEGTLNGELDIDISNGNSYIAIKKDRNMLLEQFAKSTKIGFEGFLILENNPREIRTKYELKKTPIAWINQIDIENNSDYFKNFLDENSDLVNPLQLNNLISFIDNFLEQSENPFIFLELNQILKSNNFSIVLEFLKYISNKTKNYNGIFLTILNIDVISNSQILELKNFLNEIKN